MIIDVGALVDGYHSDMTRTFVVGEPDRRAAGDLRPRARGAARRPRRGRRRRRRPATSTPRAAACSPTPGYGDWYLHGTGHGVGLDIHEDPFVVARSSTAELVVGDVVTVEPGLYRGGFGGVRIEDLVAVTADGGRTAHPPVQGLPMPAITTNDLKTGITLQLDNGLFQVVEFQHVKPGKGGAFVRTKLRNVRTGSVLERTFNAGIRVEQAIVDRQDMQFLYRDGDDYVFMNTSTYDQITCRRRRSATPPTTSSSRPSPRSPSTRARSSASRSRRRSS